MSKHENKQNRQAQAAKALLNFQQKIPRNMAEMETYVGSIASTHFSLCPVNEHEYVETLLELLHTRIKHIQQNSISHLGQKLTKDVAMQNILVEMETIHHLIAFLGELFANYNQLKHIKEKMHLLNLMSEAMPMPPHE